MRQIQLHIEIAREAKFHSEVIVLLMPCMFITAD